MRAGMPAWREAGPETRALVCLEILARISARTHEFAHAVMHTSGQAFMMAFQAGGPHAQDRGLEAVAYAYAEQTRTPRHRRLVQAAGQARPAGAAARPSPRSPRGIALLIGCNTFPTWNGYPGLFASLATGNPVLVKPHPRAVLPLALTVQVAREVLAEAGFDPNLVALAAERPGEGIAKTLAVRPEIKIIDYTGLHRLRRLAGGQRPPGAGLHREGRRQHGRHRLHRRLQGHAVQPGLLAVPLQRPDVHHPAEPADPPRRHRHRRRATSRTTRWSPTSRPRSSGLLGDDARANALLGALVNPDVKARLEAAAGLGEVALRLPRGRQPGLPGRRGPHAGDREARRRRSSDGADAAVPRRSASARSPSRSPSTRRRTRWSCCAARSARRAR